MITDELAQRMLRVKLARETGWSLEYIDDLAHQDWADFIAVFEGEGKAIG